MVTHGSMLRIGCFFFALCVLISLVHVAAAVGADTTFQGEKSAWREGFAALAPLNLTFEAWMFHSQLGDLVDLARAFPETKIVLNHIGGALAVGPYTDKREEVFAEWSQQIAKLGQFPNVYIKLGGLGMPSLMGFEMGRQDSAPSSDQLAKAWRPYIETCIAAFGPDRSMFGSNFEPLTTGFDLNYVWDYSSKEEGLRNLYEK